MLKGSFRVDCGMPGRAERIVAQDEFLRFFLGFEEVAVFLARNALDESVGVCVSHDGRSGGDLGSSAEVFARDDGGVGAHQALGFDVAESGDGDMWAELGKILDDGIVPYTGVGVDEDEISDGDVIADRSQGRDDRAGSNGGRRDNHGGRVDHRFESCVCGEQFGHDRLAD